MITTIVCLLIAGFCLYKIGQLTAEKRILEYLRKEISSASFKPDWNFIGRLIDHI